LLYDRLVRPYPPNEEERERWRREEWDPELLDQRFEALGDLAIRADWGLEREKQWSDWMEKVESAEAENKYMEEQAELYKFELGLQASRGVLATWPPPSLDDSVTQRVVVAAYQSEQDFQKDFELQPPSEASARARLGFLLAHRIAIPALDPEVALKKVIELSRTNEEFRASRRRLYDWQELMIKEGVDPRKAVKEMDRLIKNYNETVERAVKAVYYKFGFALVTAGLAIAGAALGNPLASATALLSVVQFATLDRQPVVNPNEECAPAAMFHDAGAVFKRLRLA